MTGNADRRLRELEALSRLSRRQVFDRLNQVLPKMDKDLLLEYSREIAGVIPELMPTIGFDQRSPHHAYDLYTHIAWVVSSVPPEPVLRWAALLHDVGKIPAFTLDETGRGHFRRHPQLGSEMADGILRRLAAPDALRLEVVTLIANHMIPLEPNPEKLRQLADALGETTLKKLVLLQKADMASKGTGDPDTQRYRKILELLDG